MAKKRPIHKCEIKSRWKSAHFRDHTGTLSRALSFIRENNVIWKGHFATNQYFHSNNSIQKEIRRQLNNYNWFVIHPLSKTNYLREILMLIIWLILIFNDPLRFSFISFIPNNKMPIKLMLVFMDVLSLVNVFLEFFVGYINTSTHEVILDQRLIAKRYLRTYFFIDLIGGISINLIYMSITKDEISASLLNMIRFTRCVRLKTALNILRGLVCKKQAQERYFAFVAIMLLVIYVLEFWTCLLFIVSFVLNRSGTYNTTWSTTISFGRESSFLEIIESFVRTIRFVAGIYYNIEHTAIMVNDVEYFTASLIRMTGYMLSTVILAYLIEITTVSHLSDVKFRIIMSQLQMYSNIRKLPPRLQHRLITFYKGVFKSRYFKIDIISESLSTNLKQEILIYESRFLINRVKLFADLPPHIVQWIFLNSVVEHYLINDVISDCGLVQDSICFVSCGGICVILQNGAEVRHYFDGEIIGEAALANNHIAIASTIAIEFTELLRLSYEKLEIIHKKYPDLKNKLIQSGRQKLRRYKLSIGEIKKLEKDYLEEVKTSLEAKRRRL